MYGIKVASGIVGLTLLMGAIVAGLVYGGITLFGPLWGGIAAIGAELLLMFIAIAVMANKE